MDQCNCETPAGSEHSKSCPSYKTPAIQEVDAMSAIAGVLAGHDREACARILDWAADAFAECVLHRVQKERPPFCIRGRDFGAKGEFVK